jgi:hypothetical protein
MNEKLYYLTLLKEKERRIEIQKAKRDYSIFADRYIKITDKKGKQVPLSQNYVQRTIHNKIAELQAQGIPPRIVVLKSRQMGVSTDTQGRMIYETTTKENRNGFIVSHESASTSAIFQKAKYMYDNLPDDIKPLQKASNATELIFDRPTHYSGAEKGLHSKIEIKTAGKSGIGRSETRHYVHLSEFAFWEGKDEDSPSKQLSAILQAVPDEVDTWVIVESTANGFNDFKEMWDDAVKGENGFVPLFFPWYVHEEYVIPLEDGEEHSFIESMSEYERYLYNDLKLPLERIKWWRETKKNKCNNDINQMKQENPTTPEEAFIFSGTPVFNIDKIAHRIDVLRKRYEDKPPKIGYFYFEWHNPDIMDIPKPETIRWVGDKNGCIKIYEEPKRGYPYAIGGDTKGEGSDFFAGTVKNNHTGNRAATLHGQMQSKYYTGQMYCLGHYYNDALIGIETNFNTYPIELLTDWGYMRQYMRQRLDTFTKEIHKQYGWKTDGNTRPLIIEREITLIEENIEQFNDIEFLEECLTFVKDKNGRPDAMTGKHDDILFSDMIAEAVGDQQTRMVDYDDPIDDIYEDDDEDKPNKASFFD